MSAVNTSLKNVGVLAAQRDRLLRDREAINRKLASFGRAIGLSHDAKFQFYERVLVLKDAPEVFGKDGSVLGRAQDEDGIWTYAVFVRGPNEVWDIAESDLESKGIVDKRENFYAGKANPVKVTKSGRGSLSKTAQPKPKKKR